MTGELGCELFRVAEVAAQGAGQFVEERGDFLFAPRGDGPVELAVFELRQERERKVQRGAVVIGPRLEAVAKGKLDAV